MARPDNARIGGVLAEDVAREHAAGEARSFFEGVPGLEAPEPTDLDYREVALNAAVQLAAARDFGKSSRQILSDARDFEAYLRDG